MKKVLWFGVALVLALACSETVGGVIRDAGDILADAGDMMQPDAGAQDTPVECNQQSQSPNAETKNIWHWAEFDIANPGQTEVTVCIRYNGWPWDGRVQCSRPEGDSKDLASRHLAPLHGHPRRRARRPRDSTCAATRAGTRPFQRRKGVVRFSEMEWCCRSAIRTRSTERCRST